MLDNQQKLHPTRIRVLKVMELRYELNYQKDGLVVVKGIDVSGDVIIPSRAELNAESYPVTGIGYDAFKDCENLTSITIPNSVQSIGRGAFSGCLGLKSITMPNSVKHIYDGAFSNCKSLTELTIPDSVVYIDRSAFYKCSGLTRVVIGNSVKTISSYAFEDCENLTEVKLGESVEEMGDSVFEQCRNLAEISLPDSLDSISFGKNAFRGCSRLALVAPGKGVRIAYDDFKDCVGLWKIAIPKDPSVVERMKERLRENMVPVTGFDYPFSICNRKLSQEDYTAIMGDVFSNEEVPVGPECPYVTDKWNAYSTGHGTIQNWGEIHNILGNLRIQTGRHFRLPTLKECEFINSRSNELGFRIEKELCLASHFYLCTESKDTFLSGPTHNSTVSDYISFRLVECEKPLTEIDFGGEKVEREIQDYFHDQDEDMHYYWEN